MTDSVFYRLPQLKTTTLATVGGIDDSQTTGIKLLNVTNVETTKPGIICINWSNPIDTTKYEYITYTSIDGNQELVGATRAAENSTARAHDNGVTIAFIVSKSHINELVKALDGTNSGVVLTTPVIPSFYQDSGKTKLMTTPNTASDTLVAIAATQTLTNKTLTSPAINTPIITTPTVRNYDGWIDANETWTYASADDPTYTITVPSGAASKYGVGMRIKWTQNGTVRYGIITAVADTVLTVYGGTDYNVDDAAISANYYSSQKAPLGFPLDPTKWTVAIDDTQVKSKTSATSNTWYGATNDWTSGTDVTISVPIGTWYLSYQCAGYATGSNVATIYTALSTSATGVSDDLLKATMLGDNTTGTAAIIAPVYRQNLVTIASKTTYYLIATTTNTSTINITIGTTDAIHIRAVCAYL